MYPRGVPAGALKLVLVELFCGTCSVAKIGAPWAWPHERVITVDVDPECIPLDAAARLNHFVVDMHGGTATDLPPGVRAEQLGGVSLDDLETELEALVRDGCVIIMHGSPPCDQVSCMNTKGPKNRHFPAKLAKSLRIFHAYVALANRYAVAWTLENPWTGHLWDKKWLREWLVPADRWLADVPDIANTRVVDYCQFGKPNKKTTGIACSSEEMRNELPARRCPGPKTCRMCIVLPNGLRGHAVPIGNITGIYGRSKTAGQRKKHARFPLPEELVVEIIIGLRAEADRAMSMFTSGPITPYRCEEESDDEVRTTRVKRPRPHRCEEESDDEELRTTRVKADVRVKRPRSITPPRYEEESGDDEEERILQVKRPRPITPPRREEASADDMMMSAEELIAFRSSVW
jgi:hypothetical protein